MAGSFDNDFRVSVFLCIERRHSPGSYSVYQASPFYSMYQVINIRFRLRLDLSFPQMSLLKVHMEKDGHAEEKRHWEEPQIQTTRAPHLLRGTRTARNLGFPSCQLRRGSIVRLECPSGAGQVLHPVLYKSDHGETKKPAGRQIECCGAHRLPCRRKVLHHEVFGGRVFPDVLQPRVPFRWNL